MASIEQRGKLAWCVVWRQCGRGTRKQSVTLPTEREAAIAKWLVEMRQSRITAQEVYTAVVATRTAPTGRLHRCWPSSPASGSFSGAKLGDVQPDTINDQYRIIMRRILPRLGSIPVTAITCDAVTDWVGWVKSSPPVAVAAWRLTRCAAPMPPSTGFSVPLCPRWLPANPAARLPGERKSVGLPKATPQEAIFGPGRSPGTAASLAGWSHQDRARGTTPKRGRRADAA